MKVNVTFDLSDDDRAALVHQYGHPMTRADIASWIIRNTRATLQVLVSEHDESGATR